MAADDRSTSTRPVQSGIYQIRNLINGKVYVGSAVDFKRRWSRHRQRLRDKQHHSVALQNAWNKYGKDAFVFEILEHVKDTSSLIFREQDWLDRVCPWKRQFGYNISPTAGSSRGCKQRPRSAATLANLAEAARRRSADPEYIAALSAAQKARRKREETDPDLRDSVAASARKMSASAKKRWKDPAARAKRAEYVRRRSADPDVKARASAAAKKLHADPEYRAKYEASRAILYASSEFRKQMSDTAKRLWADPAHRAKMSEAARNRSGKRPETIS